MPSITSYFNPASKEHHALDSFKNLSAGKKFLTVVLTALTTLATLPILGLGGVATFRALTNKFTVINLNEDTGSQKVKTAKKAHSQFHDIFKKCSKKEAIQTIESEHPNLNAKDVNGNTLIHIACMRKGFDEVVDRILDQDDANFDERNNDGDLPIISYVKTHRGQQNEQLHDKMVLKMNQPEFLESDVLRKDDPVFLRAALQKLSDLGKPYKLKGYTDTTELFVVLLERAQTKEEVSDIVKYYQKDEDTLSVDFFGEDQPIQKQLVGLRKAIQENQKFALLEKELALDKLNLL